MSTRRWNKREIKQLFIDVWKLLRSTPKDQDQCVASDPERVELSGSTDWKSLYQQQLDISNQCQAKVVELEALLFSQLREKPESMKKTKETVAPRSLSWRTRKAQLVDYDRKVADGANNAVVRERTARSNGPTKKAG